MSRFTTDGQRVLDGTLEVAHATEPGWAARIAAALNAMQDIDPAALAVIASCATADDRLFFLKSYVNIAQRHQTLRNTT